ncbi:hypothetical protein KKE19_04020 [Patescibacteria group bacterium]|nr:hypothetical protein [Patescibacteria group bacterium]MBU4367870.1 hypothetical protein [Patescibacteria group bacterium]MBU4461953.1 hypothetical protein [Patescibacteria group bacterium]MCG2699896.1 hypothetical protein [Candidatus Parcubacteria bacterium]
MRLIKITCVYCGKKFFREFGRVNEANKFSWNQYCSKECQNQAKVTRIEQICANPNCNKKVSRLLNQFKKSKSGHIFCSSFCAAAVNNLSRRKTKTCFICKKQFYGKTKYCSKFCYHNWLKSKPRTIRITKIKIISRIKEFCRREGRIPFKEEFPHYNTAQKRFGSWNKAIEAAGFKTNPVLFAKKHIANDGHKCDSLAEKIIDDWLSARRIKHKRGTPYPENKKLTADFVLKNNWVEFFGLAGKLKEYDKLVRRKQILSKKHNLQLIEIYPKDLFPRNRLSEIIRIKKI